MRLGFDLILLGAPAAGKDTQAEILKKKYSFHAVESGKYWRKMAAQNSPTGKLLRRTFSKGHPAPVRLMKQFIVKQLRSAPQGQDLLFIGNPRLKPEAQLLTRLLRKQGHDYLAIAIDLPEKEIRRRSLLRMRDDQDWKYVDNRIRMYRLQVSKTLGYFNDLNRLKTVKGNQTIPKVAAAVQKAIDDHKRRKTTGDAQKKRPNTGRGAAARSQQVRARRVRVRP